MLALLLGLIRRFEGLRLKKYLCPAKVWTIGYGHTGPAVKLGEITKEKAEELLQADAMVYVRAVLRISPVLARYPEILAAIADFAYNLGIARYKASTLRRRVDAEDWDGVQEELAKWIWGGGRKLPGLQLRRAAEAAIVARAAAAA